MDELDKKEILQTYKWIKVKRYKDDEDFIDETNFLIDKIRDIVKNL